MTQSGAISAGLQRKIDKVFEVEKENGDNHGDGDVDGNSEGEDLKMEVGETCGRVKLEEEGAVIKKLIDPKLPSQEAVDRHWLMGHV